MCCRSRGGLASMPAYGRIACWTEHSLRKHLWVLLAYIALSLVLTWPLAAHFATHVPGDGIDDPALAWNLWWIRHALVEHPQNPFLVGWQFWPIASTRLLHAHRTEWDVGHSTTNGLRRYPTYNLLLLASFALSGFGAYLLCLDFADRRRKKEDGGSALPLAFCRSPSARSSEARCMRSLPPSCSTQPWVRATLPARNGCRSRHSTPCAQCDPRVGCATRL